MSTNKGEIGVVGGGRRQHSDTGSAQPLGINFEIRRQDTNNGLRPPARQIEVVVIGTLIIGVTDDQDGEARIARKQG